MEAESEASDHDDEDNRNREKGDDHVLKEDDVLSNTRAICRQCWTQHGSCQAKCREKEKY